jgi:hypothetical protein
MGLGLPEAGVEAQCSTTEDIGSMIMSSGVPVLRVQNLSCGQSFRSDSQGLWVVTSFRQGAFAGDTVACYTPDSPSV